MAIRAARPRRSSPAPRERARPSLIDAWPSVPPGLDVTWLSLHGDSLAILSYPLPEPPPLPGLSSSERDVVDHILAGRSNAGIAARRGTSARTVANQVAMIFKKLGVGSRRELIALVARNASDSEGR
jgi:DNA-binding CsgD family transcriptional regulator